MPAVPVSTVRVHLFVPCFVDTLSPEAAIATTRVLERLGHDVVFPTGQTCCGQIHYNTGYGRHVLPLVRRFVDVFADADAVVAPSASCVATVHDAYPRLARESGDASLEQRVSDLGPRVFELTRWLVREQGVDDVGARFPRRVAYHPTCHSLRALGLADEPLRLLRAVRDLSLVEIPDARECCGFGGTFAVKNAAVSSAMLDDKLGALEASGAEVCTAVDSSCLLHVAGGLHRRGSRVRIAHIAEILASTGSPSSGGSRARVASPAGPDNAARRR